MEEVKPMFNILTPKNMKNKVVNVKTEKQSNKILSLMQAKGWKWRNGNDPLNLGKYKWSDYGSKTCFDLETKFGFSSTDYAIGEDSQVLTYKEAVKFLEGVLKKTVDLEIVQKKIVKYSDDTVSYALDEIKLDDKIYTPEELHEESKRLIRTRTRYNKLIKSNQL